MNNLDVILKDLNKKEVKIMEDRYLFKAKRLDDGEWVPGYIVKYGFTGQKEWYIVSDYASDLYSFLIDKNTICQCTGLKDKNGKLIWENDIVRDRYGNFYIAFWQSKYYQFSWICIKSDVLMGVKTDLWNFKSSDIEVIGNKFDDPKLLESGE